MMRLRQKDPKTYRGEVGGVGTLVWVFDPSTGIESRLTHYIRHSPDGFSWGYSGSGPSELARCLLIDALEDDGRCRRCAGDGRLKTPVRIFEARQPIDIDEQCGDCLGSGVGELVEANYRQFRTAVIAPLNPTKRWELTQGEIVAVVQRLDVLRPPI